MNWVKDGVSIYLTLTFISYPYHPSGSPKEGDGGGGEFGLDQRVSDIKGSLQNFKLIQIEICMRIRPIGYKCFCIAQFHLTRFFP